MKFSEYTITTKPEQSVDPLGFTQTFGVLRNRFYPQFTVLSNWPVYHGIIALIYQLLAERKSAIGKSGFAKLFRDAECLWGLANVAAGKSVLNVTKYQVILKDRSRVALTNIRSGDAIFRSLNYGTLGHYSNPSVAWGLLERGATQLTPMGNRLANAFAKRGGHSLKSALERWLGRNEIERAELVTLGNAYGTDSPPSHSERDVWKAAVDAWRKHAPDTAALWTNPPDRAEVKMLCANDSAYRNFFPTLAARYPRLAEDFTQSGRFEAIYAVCVFLFEREYLLCHDAGVTLPNAGVLEEQLAVALAHLARKYIDRDSRKDKNVLFAALANTSDHATTVNVLLGHHLSHQKAKNALPYLENGKLLIRDRFDRQRFTSLHEELTGLTSPEDCLALLAYRYRRDWHIDRAMRYSHYIRDGAK